ncbi:MAG: hypothetical protein O6945_15865, partial [Gammaproteobacteria bacterium]|nr:hypothetical protein [Gammaproteobacteria bacterium]
MLPAQARLLVRVCGTASAAPYPQIPLGKFYLAREYRMARQIAQMAAKNFTRTQLEMGGKNLSG